MAKKMTEKQFRKKLDCCSRDDLENLLAEMYSASPYAFDYLNIKFGDPGYKAALHEDALKKVRGGFYTRGGKARLSVSQAKDSIKWFSGICPDTSLVLDLKLSFVAYAADIAVNYYNLPSSFYRDADNMFQSVVDTLNSCDDRSMFELFDERIKELIRNSVGAEGGMHKSLEGMYDQIRWTKKDVPAAENVDDASDGSDGFSGAAHISSAATAGEKLSEEDTALFYKLWGPLLEYVNRKKHVNELKHINIGKPYSQSDLDPNMLKEIANTLWCEPSLIDDYLEEFGAEFSDDEKYILRGWKKAVSGRFVLERHLKKGSIFLSLDDNKVYQVKGLVSSWREMMWMQQPPILLLAALLPFRDVIISDGIVMPMNIYIGGNMSKTFRETYMTAKRRGQIISDMHSVK